MCLILGMRERGDLKMTSVFLTGTKRWSCNLLRWEWLWKKLLLSGSIRSLILYMLGLKCAM